MSIIVHEDRNYHFAGKRIKYVAFPLNVGSFNVATIKVREWK